MMRHTLEHDLHALASARDEHALFATLSRLGRDLGFEHCSYGMRLPLPVGRGQFALLSDYSSAWQARYVERNYFVTDPTVRHGLTRQDALVWSATEQREEHGFWEEARAFQLRHGWCMPARGQHGSIGMLSFVRSSEAVSASEREAHESRLIHLCQLAHGAMTTLLSPQLMPESRSTLTARERECLLWTASGKTYAEIATILGIDTRTVKFHLVNTMQKLQAANKTEAAIKATVLGLLA